MDSAHRHLAGQQAAGMRKHRGSSFFDCPAGADNVVITADNAYGFGRGTAGAMSNYFGGALNTTGGASSTARRDPRSTWSPVRARATSCTSSAGATTA